MIQSRIVTFVLLLFVLFALACSKDEPAAEPKLTGLGVASYLNLANSSPNVPKGGINGKIVDESGIEYDLIVIKNGNKPNANVHFENEQLMDEDTYLAPVQKTNSIDVLGLKSNTLVITFMSENGMYGARTIRASVNKNTLFGLQVEDQNLLKSYKENISGSLKPVVDNVVENSWARDINGAMEGDQHQEATVQITLKP